MPEIVSATIGACCVGYAALQGYARRGSAVSSEAEAVGAAASAVIELAERSEALFGAKATAISALREVSIECAQADWDGMGALPLNPLAIISAEMFLRALPTDFPLPEIAGEPDGAVSLDWIDSRHRLFSVSVGPSARLAFAWLDGSDRGHGVARFDGLSVPTRVLEGIRSITQGSRNASLRAA